ncbi:MAG: hypothetical protein IPJ50_12430 [Betaproteobacteria bacterium]|nr:hypothetical protein [Betaproteobacteria bacterium]
MIDTCKFYAPLTNRVRRALSIARDAEHPNVKIYGNYFFLKHPHGLKNIKVYFNLDRRKFWLETSLPKVLQGHNVFGSNNLEMLCLAVIKLVYAQLGVKFLDEEREIREAGIRLVPGYLAASGLNHLKWWRRFWNTFTSSFALRVRLGLPMARLMLSQSTTSCVLPESLTSTTTRDRSLR